MGLSEPREWFSDSLSILGSHGTRNLISWRDLLYPGRASAPPTVESLLRPSKWPSWHRRDQGCQLTLGITTSHDFVDLVGHGSNSLMRVDSEVPLQLLGGDIKKDSEFGLH